MVMLQSDRLDDDRRRVAALGVRVVWQIDLDDIRDTHLHPADVGGAILALDDATSPASWRWAGPDWEAQVRTDRVRAITGVQLAAADPEALAARWARGARSPARPAWLPDRLEIALAPGTLRFVRAPRRRRRTSVATTSPSRTAIACSTPRGHAASPSRDDAVTIAGHPAAAGVT